MFDDANESTIEYKDIANKDGHYVSITIPGTQAQTAGNYSFIFTPRNPIEVLRVTAKWSVLASAASTLDVVLVNDGSAISTGVSILKTTFDLTGTANTAVVKESVNLAKNRQVKENQSLALKTTGLLTDLQSVHVTIYFKTYARGTYK